MTTIEGTDRLEALEHKLDALAEQLSFVAAEAHEARRRREARTELWDHVVPVAREALDDVDRRLEELSDDVSADDLVGLGTELVRNASNLEAALAQLRSLSELADQVAPLTEDVLAAATDRLSRLEERGYVEFARGAAGVADRVVGAFGADDLDALGDNVVLILQTVKEMTQPEIMSMLGHAAVAAREDEPEHVSMLELLRRMRDPAVKRGLLRLLHVLETLGERPASSGDPSRADPTPTTSGGDDR